MPAHLILKFARRGSVGSASSGDSGTPIDFDDDSTHYENYRAQFGVSGFISVLLQLRLHINCLVRMFFDSSIFVCICMHGYHFL